MNLYELNALIAQLVAECKPSENKDILDFYFRKRREMVAEIARKVQIGLRTV